MLNFITFLLGLVVLLATFWAGQYVVHCCLGEWYAVSAILTIWVVRVIALVMMWVALETIPKKS